MAFGKEIKRLRKKAKLSAQKTADLLGVGVDRFRQWELRDSDPVDERDKLSIEKSLGVPLEKITTLENFPKLSSKGRADTTELILDCLMEIITGQRVTLSLLAEILAPTMKEKTLPTQLAKTFQKMVKDERQEVIKEMNSKIKV